jgi:hypothetical protein
MGFTYTGSDLQDVITLLQVCFLYNCLGNTWIFQYL